MKHFYAKGRIQRVEETRKRPIYDQRSTKSRFEKWLYYQVLCTKSM